MNKKKTFFTTLILLIMPLCCSLAQSAAVDYPMNYSMEFTRCFGMPGLNLSWGFDKPYEEARILVNDFNVNKNSDFDFNDLVFDAKFTSSGARLTVWAVGTTSPIKVGGREAHELFGVSTSTLINTKDMAHNAITFDIEGDYAGDFNNIEVEMQDENGDWHLLQSRRGDATTKLAVPTSVKWCMENENISKVYPDFSNYVFGYECNWWENYQGSQIAVETKRTIHVAQAGTLRDIIPIGEKYQIEELTLTGEINGEDLGFLRDMAGQSPSRGCRNGDTTEGRLKSLDISMTKIVSGGLYIVDDRYASMDMPKLEFYLVSDDEIPAFLFDGCTVLETIKVPDDLKSIGFHAFDGTTWYNNQPDGFVYLGNVFYKYKGDMPDNTEITIKEGTLGIAGLAFENCKNMISITIPNSVVRIGGLWSEAFMISGNNVFCGCSGLKDVYCYAETIPETYSYLFGYQGKDINNAILHVTANSILAYSNTEPWSYFKEIVPLDGSGVQAIEADNRVIQINSIRGERLSAPSKGINIIKMKDGTTKKILVK